MQKLIIALILAFFCACSTSRDVKFQVEVVPPQSFVEVNAVTVCDHTPCEITLKCGSLAFADSHYHVSAKINVQKFSEVRLPAGTDLVTTTETKDIDACEVPKDSEGRLDFLIIR